MVSPHKKKKIDKKGRVAAVESNPLIYPGTRRTRTSIKPLTDKKFYLDIKNHASLKKIEAKLTSLGARLELFLVREVDYVVTDREDYPRIGGRHQQIPTPSPLPSFCSVSPVTPTSPHDGLAVKRTRSRAEAMLERVKHQPQTKNTGDILDNALTWRIPIYPLPRFISWLEKVAKKAEKLYDSGGTIVEKGVKELKGAYLKVETSSRPEFRQFNSWPTLGLHKDQQNNKNHSNEFQRMTRKVGKAAKEASSAPGGGNGYCEMCRIHYDNLDAHVTSAEHLKLVTDPVQYSHLDSIIAQHNLGVTSVRKSLRVAKSPPPFLPPEMGGRQSSETPINNSHSNQNHHQPQHQHHHHQQQHHHHNHHNTSSPRIVTPSPPLINGHVTRSKTAATANLQPAIVSQCNGLERRRSRTQCSPNETLPRHHYHNDQGSPTEAQVPTASPLPSISEHNLRPRRSLRAVTPPTNQSIVSIPTPIPPLPHSSSSVPLPATKEKTPPPHSHTLPTPSTPKNQMIVKPSLPPPRRTSRVIRKRLSVEEKLIEDNKSYYKVEVLNSKLRSTEYFIAQNKIDAQSRLNGTVPANVSVQQDNKTSVKTPEKAPVVVRFKKVRKTELAVLSNEAESFMFGEPKKTVTESSDSSEDEDEDEADGEEEEDRGTRTTGVTTIHNNNNNNTSVHATRYGGNSQQKSFEEETNNDIKPCLPILQPPPSPDLTVPPPSSPPHLQHIKDEPEDPTERCVTFSFDMAPLREPWLETYKRQDEGTELFYIPQYHSYPSVLLPYQIPHERQFKKFFGSASGLYSSGLRKRDRLTKLLDDRPRKSPRCHASTLAIMSSLMRRHRPGRECDRSFTYEEDSSLASDIIESSSNSEKLNSQPANIIHNISSVQQTVYSAVMNPEGIDRIGEALINGKTEISTMEPCLAVDPKAITDGLSIANVSQGLNMDITTLVDTYQHCTSLEVGAFEQIPSRPFESIRFTNSRFGADSCASSDCSDLFGFSEDGRVVSKKRKRKRNMTGWPQPKRKVLNNTPSSTVKDILAEQPPVDVNQFECVQGITGTMLTPLKRRGRPPKNRLIDLANNSDTVAPLSPSLVVPMTPIKKRMHKLFSPRK